MRVLLFDAMERHQNTRRAAPKDARRCNRAGTNQDGNKGAVTQLKHQFVLGAISFKWQTMLRRTFKSGRVQDVFNISTDDVGAFLARQTKQAIIHMQNGSIELADDDSIARDLD